MSADGGVPLTASRCCSGSAAVPGSAYRRELHPARRRRRHLRPLRHFPATVADAPGAVPLIIPGDYPQGTDLCPVGVNKQRNTAEAEASYNVTSRRAATYYYNHCCQYAALLSANGVDRWPKYGIFYILLPTIKCTQIFSCSRSCGDSRFESAEWLSSEPTLLYGGNCAQ